MSRWAQTGITLVVILGTVLLINTFQANFFAFVGDIVMEKVDDVVGFAGDKLGPTNMALGNTGRVKVVEVVVVNKDIMQGATSKYGADWDALDAKRYIITVVYQEIEYSIESESLYQRAGIGNIIAVERVKSGNTVVLRAPIR